MAPNPSIVGSIGRVIQDDDPRRMSSCYKHSTVLWVEEKQVTVDEVEQVEVMLH